MSSISPLRHSSLASPSKRTSKEYIHPPGGRKVTIINDKSPLTETTAASFDTEAKADTEGKAKTTRASSSLFQKPPSPSEKENDIQKILKDDNKRPPKADKQNDLNKIKVKFDRNTSICGLSFRFNR